MPESVTDRPSTAVEYVYLLSKSAKYFWDAESIRQPHADTNRPNGFKGKDGIGPRHDNQGWSTGKVSLDKHREYNPSGRNFRNSDPFFASWQGLWIEDEAMALVVNPKGYSEAHFATFPEGLVTPLIKAGTSEKGCCPECREPWVRVVEKGEPVNRKDNPNDALPYSAESGHTHGMGKTTLHKEVETRTIGWRPGCSHGMWYMGSRRALSQVWDPFVHIPCEVLDPFAGSGTVNVVAYKLRRDCTGIEINPDYIEMGRERIDRLTAQGRLF